MSQSRRIFAWVLGLSFVAGSVVNCAWSAAADEPLVYFGTYTNTGKSKGIYVARFDKETGKISEPTLAAETGSPSYLAISENRKFLYSANEVDMYQGKKGGYVSSFSIDPASGKLTLLNEQSSHGDGPCYVSLDHTGKVVLVANYFSGSVASYLVADNGGLKPAATIDQHKAAAGAGPKVVPHGHCFDLDPANKFALSADLGLDEIYVYKLDTTTGVLTPNTPPFASVATGSGPRHLAFSPNGKFVYSINELASTVIAFSYDAEHGALKQIETVGTLPKDFKGTSSTAEIIFHPSGKFVYGSNRGSDTIVIFKADAATGKLTVVGHESTQGKTPRGFNIDPTGKFLIAANQNTDNVVVFSIDPNSGALKPTGQQLHIGAPVHVLFLKKI